MEYAVHDLVLDFAKRKIKEDEVFKETATFRQAQYLSRQEVLEAYADRGDFDGCFYTLIALWRSVEKMSDGAVSTVKS